MLLKKGILVNNICSICGEQNESLFHIFFFGRKLSYDIWDNWCPNGLPVSQNIWDEIEE